MSTYGLAGSSPLADLSNTVNVLLKDAIAAVWNTDVTAPPAITDMIFSTGWFSGRKDIECVFKTLSTEAAFFMKTIGNGYQGYIDTIDIHVGVRGRTGDTQPAMLNATINGLSKIIHTRCNTLITNMYMEPPTVTEGPTEIQDDRQTFYHRVLTLRCYYWKVKTT